MPLSNSLSNNSSGRWTRSFSWNVREYNRRCHRHLVLWWPRLPLKYATERKSRILMIGFADRRSGETSQRYPTRSTFFEEFTATGESSASRNPRVLRQLRLPYRSTAHRPVDPRLSILAQIYRLRPQELGIDINWMEGIGTSVSRTRRSRPTDRQHYGIRNRTWRRLPRGIASSNFEDWSPSPRWVPIR
jgi:hypothetical protein